MIVRKQQNWFLVAVAIVFVVGLGLGVGAISKSRAGGTKQGSDSEGEIHAHPGANSVAAKDSAPIEILNVADFDQQIGASKMPILVDFYADWCGPCRVQGRILKDLSGEIENAKIVKVNVDKNRDLAARYRINSIPALLVFKDGQVVRRHVGLADKEQLTALLAD